MLFQRKILVKTPTFRSSFGRTALQRKTTLEVDKLSKERSLRSRLLCKSFSWKNSQRELLLRKSTIENLFSHSNNILEATSSEKN